MLGRGLNCLGMPGTFLEPEKSEDVHVSFSIVSRVFLANHVRDFQLRLADGHRRRPGNSTFCV